MNARAAALLAVVAASWFAEPAAAACSATPVKDVNPQYGIRTGVSQLDPTDLWISGTLAYSMSRTYPYVERYDAVSGWSLSLLDGMARSAFTGIAAISATQAMAVGFEDGGTTALAVFFDGDQWSQTLGEPSQSPIRGTLQGIAAVPSTSTAYAVLAYGAFNLLYWNGSSWSPVADALPVGAVLAVGASSAHDVWAVGGLTNRFGVARGLVERWDGHQWMRLPAPAPYTILTSVTVHKRNDVWVTGLSQQGPAFVPIAARWNGKVWSKIGLPFGNVFSAVYGAVQSASPVDVWVSASAPRRDGGLATSLWHWNGHAWGYVADSEGWTATPLLGGAGKSVWFAAGSYRRTRSDGNKYVGFAECDT